MPRHGRSLGVDERNELVGDVAGLPSELVDEDQEAKQFDLLMLRLQLGLLRHERSFTRWSEDVREIAGALEEKASHPDGAGRAGTDHRSANRRVLAGHYGLNAGGCPQAAAESGQVHRKTKRPRFTRTLRT